MKVHQFAADFHIGPITWSKMSLIQNPASEIKGLVVLNAVLTLVRECISPRYRNPQRQNWIQKWPLSQRKSVISWRSLRDEQLCSYTLWSLLIIEPLLVYKQIAIRSFNSIRLGVLQHGKFFPACSG